MQGLTSHGKDFEIYFKYSRKPEGFLIGGNMIQFAFKTQQLGCSGGIDC